MIRAGMVESNLPISTQQLLDQFDALVGVLGEMSHIVVRLEPPLQTTVQKFMGEVVSDMSQAVTTLRPIITNQSLQNNNSNKT